MTAQPILAGAVVTIEVDTNARRETINVTNTSGVEVVSAGHRGLSAYQVALANGFVGTEAQWLASLVGSPGEGVPTGGTAGQVLTKASNVDYDAEWSTPAESDVTSVNGQTGLVVLNQDDIPDGTTAKQFTAIEKTKLAGIAAGATNVTATSQIANDSGFITAASAPVQSVAGRSGVVILTKADVGLGNVDNTSDANKPVSTATQTALNAKQGTLTLTTTGTSGPATLTGDTLNIPQYGGGAGAVSSVFSRTGAVVAQAGDYTTAQVTESGNLYFTDARARSALSGANGISYVAGTGVISPSYGSTANTVAQGNDARFTDSRAPTGAAGGELSGTYPNPTLSNAAVIGKLLTGFTPSAGIVAATDSVLGAFQKIVGNIGALVTGVSSVAGRTGAVALTKADVGLVNVDNTSDAAKPISTATQTALDGKQPLATVLTNTTASFTTAQESKLAGIAPGATANQTDAFLLNRSNHTGTQLAATISDFAATARSTVLTGYTSGAGTVAATDSILQAIQKLNGNDGLKANIAGQVFTGAISATNLSGTNTGDQTTITGNAGTATALQTGRTISITGDLTYTSPSFNGTGNVTAAGTLATVNANVGSFGLAGSVAQFTVNAKGLITAAANVAISIAATAISDATAAGRAMLTAATAAAQTALLDVFTSGAKGLAPASGGGTVNFLRADGTWAAPGGGGSVAWGAITGTLSAQTDLQTALNGKLGTSAEAATVATINGRISAGTNVTITGVGTAASPYVIEASGGGGGGLTQAQVLARGLGA